MMVSGIQAQMSVLGVGNKQGLAHLHSSKFSKDYSYSLGPEGGLIRIRIGYIRLPQNQALFPPKKKEAVSIRPLSLPSGWPTKLTRVAQYTLPSPLGAYGQVSRQQDLLSRLPAQLPVPPILSRSSAFCSRS